MKTEADARPREHVLVRAARAVETFYVGDYPIYPLVIIRIGLGFFLVLQNLSMLPWFTQIWGPEGLMSFVLDETTWVMEHHLVVFWLLVACGLAYMVGFMTRLSGTVAIVCHILLHQQVGVAQWGDGMVGHLFIFYTLLGNPGGRLSVDAWLRRRFVADYEPPETCIAVPVRLLQLHITAIYFMAAYNRLFTKGWWAGRMTFVALESGTFSRFPNVDFVPYRTLAWLGTWFTWLLELAAPIGLWVRKTRPYFWVGCFAMHMGLELTSTIGSWQVYMMTVLTVWMPLAWAEKAVHWVEERLGLGGGERAS